MQLLIASPRLMLYVPPVAGNIILVHDLFLRAKKIARVVESATQFSPEHKMKVQFCILYILLDADKRELGMYNRARGLWSRGSTIKFQCSPLFIVENK